VKAGKVRGCPGAGKTRYLLGLIAQAVEKYGPEHVGAVSFTNAAVEEMKERAVKDVGIDKECAKNIKTIHSHCWHLLDMKKDRLAETNIKHFNEVHPAFQISTSKIVQDDELPDANIKQNDRLYSEMNVMRNRLVDMKNWNIDVKEFYRAWKSWMDENNFLDFTGTLEDTLLFSRSPEVEVLFIDEAQDMSLLQARLTEQWSQETVSTIWVGDPDQSIFRFAGAEPAAFSELKTEWNKYLNQSYRLPIKIHEYTVAILDKITDREPMDILPTEVEGQVIYTDYPDLSLEGSHMILCRCNYQVHRWIKWLSSQQIIWHNPYREKDLTWNPTKTKSWIATKLYQKLAQGEMLTITELKKLGELTISKGNMKHKAKKYLQARADDGDKVNMSSIADHGFEEGFMSDKLIAQKLKLTGKAAELIIGNVDIVKQEPKVIVGTIHSVKGGETDHVWVDCDLPFQVMRAVQTDQNSYNDELRIKYVACTRARHTLGLLNEGGQI
jgi:superfamily I DNA/RNA helicase